MGLRARAGRRSARPGSGHLGAQPADDEADREEGDAGGEWASEPAPVDDPADEDDADQRAEHERGEYPAVELDAVQLAGDDRHDRRDREGFERDEGDRQDEPD